MKICVLGGRGGAGASTLAAGLAITAQRKGSSALLIDADPLGGGLDLILGAEDLPGLRWTDLATASGRVEPTALLAALPDPGALPVLAMSRDGPCEVSTSAMQAVLAAVSPRVDLVVVDLPRRLDDAATEAVRVADAVVLLVPAEIRAVAAARLLVDGLFDDTEVHLVVRRPSPAGLPPDEVAAALGLPLAATLQVEAGLARRVEQGEPPARTGRGELAELCGGLLDAFARLYERDGFHRALPPEELL